MPIVPCTICFILGGIIGAFAIAIVSVTSDCEEYDNYTYYDNCNYYEGDECDGL